MAKAVCPGHPVRLLRETMRVAIDTNPLYVTRAGVARYVRGLLQGLATLKPSDCEWRPLAWAVENFDYQQPARACKTAYRELVWARWVAPRHLAAQGAEVLHSTAGCLIDPPSGMRHVVTLHDLALLRHPERFRRWQRFAGARRLRRLMTVDRVICVSQFTADEAMRLLHLPARSLTVVHNGCDDLFLSTVLPEQPPASVPKEFFLFVGSLEPGKNLKLLREVWALAERAGHRLPPLLVAGTRWAGVPGEGPPPPDWHYLGHVSDAELAQLYGQALALVFPSKYEGFGLPVLEALARGCPVICSRVASLPEIAGDAAWWCELDAGSYLATLRECAGNGPARAERIRAGRVQARKFSWTACAAETVDVYRTVARKGV